MSASIKASFINEGTQEIERNAVKITLSNCQSCGCLTTYPLEMHPRNSIVLSLLKEELHPYRRSAYLGISFSAYENVSYISFCSTFKSFPLNKGDEFTFYFEEDEKLIFSLDFENKKEGGDYKNKSLIKDSELNMMKDLDLKYWKLTNKEKNISIIGGFSTPEYNSQYSSERIGRKLLKLMAKNTLQAKKKLEVTYLS